MTELKRLVDEESDKVVLAMLRSADDDVPDKAGRARTLGALGLGGGTLAVATGVKAAGFAGWKWLGLAALVGASTIGFAASRGFGDGTDAYHPTRPPTASPVVSPAPVRTVPVVAPAPPAPAEAESGDVAALPSATATASAPAKAAAPSASGAARLGAELASLDSARSLLASGDAAGALAQLNRYEREFASPVLSQEATMLRIEALHAKGDQREARALAERFLATHPSNAYEDRVRTLLGER